MPILENPIFDIFRFKGYIIRRLKRPIISVSIPTAIFCLLHEIGVLGNLEINVSLPSLLGAALGILLVFRNNTAYDRWWEARKVLGAMVNQSRSFALLSHRLFYNDAAYCSFSLYLKKPP